MASLAVMQRAAEREIKKLGLLAVPVRVQWAGRATCKLSRRWHNAHAHCYPGEMFGTICVRRGLKGDWRELIRHEVAHFGPDGKGHGTGFLKTRAAQGSVSARRELVAAGKARCARHQWLLGAELERKVTRRGIVVTYSGKCRNCGAVR